MIRSVCILILGCLVLTVHPSSAAARRLGACFVLQPVAQQQLPPRGNSPDQHPNATAQNIAGNFAGNQHSNCFGAAASATIDRVVLRRQGDDNVHTYRIPGLTTSARGTLLAVFDLRHSDSADLPGNIDVGLMRSTDDGRTWSPLQVILNFDQAEADSAGNGVGDSAILADLRTGKLFVAALWSHGRRAWKESGPGLSPEETGQLVITTSDDDGLTWSAPINITAAVQGRSPQWRLFFNGPGRGIQLQDGSLVFTAQYRDTDGTPHACFIISRDAGVTWTVSAPAIPQQPPTSESQIAELPDGSLLLSMRDESHSGLRAWARYEWNADRSSGTWTKHWSTVPDPTCMASLLSLPDGRLVFCNPNSPTDRVALTVRTSTDGGMTWNDGLLIDSRPSAYSCLTSLRDGRLGVIYETGDNSSNETLTFSSFALP